MKVFSRFILFKILGWRMINSFPENLNKYIIIAAPHTSWVDFPLAILARNSTGIKINFIGKDSLFKSPFGFYFRYLGGIPVDRSKNNNFVNEIVSIFNSRDEFRLGLSPEGTRKKVEKWKSGFYFIAKGAGVPIVMATLDFKEKVIKISEPYYTTEDQEKDFSVFYDFYKTVQGRYPNRF